MTHFSGEDLLNGSAAGERQIELSFAKNFIIKTKHITALVQYAFLLLNIEKYSRFLDGTSRMGSSWVLWFFSIFSVGNAIVKSKPNVVYVMVDDWGWASVYYQQFISL